MRPVLRFLTDDLADRIIDEALAVFSCAPTTPFKWSETTSQNLLDCADSLESSWQQPGLGTAAESDLLERMTAAAAAHGMNGLPEGAN